MNIEKKERALVLGVNLNDGEDFERSMQELGNLAEACNMEVAGQITQKLPQLHSALYMGKGKLAEIKEYVEREEIDVLIFDRSLSPSQQRNLQEVLDYPIEETLDTMNELQSIILSETSDLQTKNDAYNDLITISNNKSIEQKLEKIILDEFKYDAFVKINGDNVTIVIDSSEHDFEIANTIIRRISQEFDKNKYITVKFN